MIDILFYIGIGYLVIVVMVFLFLFFYFGTTPHAVERFVGGLIIGLFFPWFAWIWYSEREQRQAQRDFLAKWDGKFDAEGENNEKDI